MSATSQKDIVDPSHWLITSFCIVPRDGMDAAAWFFKSKLNKSCCVALDCYIWFLTWPLFQSLCAQFATGSFPINQFYGSSSRAAAEKEIECFFPPQSTLALIKPHVSQEQRCKHVLHHQVLTSSAWFILQESFPPEFSNGDIDFQFLSSFWLVVPSVFLFIEFSLQILTYLYSFPQLCIYIFLDVTQIIIFINVALIYNIISELYSYNYKILCFCDLSQACGILFFFFLVVCFIW